MTDAQSPVLSRHHTPLSTEELQAFGIPTDWTFGIGFRATFGDLDLQNHVSNVIYLRWIEAFRFHYLRENGWPEYATPGASQMVIRRNEVDYLAPVQLDEDIVVTGKTVSFRSTSCIMEYAIWGAGLKAKAKAVLVFLDDQGQKAAIPAPLRTQMETRDGATKA